METIFESAFKESHRLNLDPNQNIHIIGAGGVGMSGLAHLLKNLGFKISASDLNGGEYLDRLAADGIDVWTGHQPNKIPSGSTVFKSTAVPENDPEVLYALAQKMPVYSRDPLLQFITQKYYTIAVCGTHGKTTTTGWITFLLREAGLDPSALVGGTLNDFGSNVLIGHGTKQDKPILVIEADESDRSFLSIDADIVVATNIELDHTDRYESARDFDLVFAEFFSTVLSRGGSLIPSVELRAKLEEPLYESFQKSLPHDIFEFSLDATKNVLEKDGVFMEVGLKGQHNLYNATAVFNLGRSLGISIEVIAHALKKYSGVKRRMQLLCRKKTPAGGEIALMDDYAHHPEEIKAVWNAIKNDYDNFIVVWEPHRISRLFAFLPEYLSLFRDMQKEKKVHLKRMPIFQAGDSPENFSDYDAKIRKVQKAIPEEYTFDEDWKAVDLSTRTLILFLGAGNSSSEAHQVAKIICSDK